MNQREFIEQQLRDYGFGAVFEVTNGIKSAYGAKANQAINAKRFLRMLTGKEVPIATGLAYFLKDPEIDLAVGINAIIKVEGYNPQMLRDVMAEMLENCLVSGNDRRFTELAMSRSDVEWDLPGFIVNRQQELHKRAHYLGLTQHEYEASLGIVKGFIMELYIEHLFRDRIPQGAFVHRLKYRLDHNPDEKRESDADVVIACKQSNFYHVVEEINSQPNIEARVLTRKLD